MKKSVVSCWLLAAGVAMATGARGEEVEYMDGTELKSADCQLFTENTRTIKGWYAVKGDVVINSSIAAIGAAHLILCDGASLKVNRGVSVEFPNALTIYGQHDGTGTLVALGGDNAAGIGSGLDREGGSVTINGGRVTATGGKGGAGIGGAAHDSESGGVTGVVVTVNGGTVIAKGDKGGAGIGGSCNIASGRGGFSPNKKRGFVTVTINGGTVTATSGDALNRYGDGGAGIGGGRNGVFCDVSVTVNDGTVVATGGSDAPGIGSVNGKWKVTIRGGIVTANGGNWNVGIGGNVSGKEDSGEVAVLGGTVTAKAGYACDADIGNRYGFKDSNCTVAIDGGSVKASEIRNAPKNKAGKDLHRVVVEVEKLNVEKLNVDGLGEYGTKDIVPIDGRVYLWLPDGTHSFKISDGPTTLRYCAIVKGRDVTVEPLPPVVRVGFFVNGMDVGEGPGPDWGYDNNVLTLARAAEYVLSGTALNNEVQIKPLAEGAKVILSNAVVITSGRAAMEFEQSASLLMAGDTSYLMTTNGASAVTVAECATLTVDLGPGGDRLESMICVFGFEKSAIGGGGAVEVNGGTLFALASAPAFAEGVSLKRGEGVVMKTGADPETATIATKFDKAGEAPCVLAAPVVTVTVAKDIPHVSNITVSNAVERIKGEEIGDSMIYRAMLEDDVFVGYEVEAGYAAQEGNPLAYPRAEAENITILTIPIAPAPVSPDAPLVYDTPGAAAEAAKVAAFTPSPEVEDALTTDDALTAYCKMFKLEVVPFGESRWAVEAVLTPEAESNLVESASAATRQIPLADIAAMTEEGKTDVTVEGCLPGFYYTLYGGSDLGWVTPRSEGAAGTVDVYGPVLCEPDKPVTFEAVEKPSDTAGFFSIGVKETSNVNPSDARLSCPVP